MHKEGTADNDGSHDSVIKDIAKKGMSMTPNKEHADRCAASSITRQGRRGGSNGDGSFNINRCIIRSAAVDVDGCNGASAKAKKKQKERRSSSKSRGYGMKDEGQERIGVPQGII
eukprot:scaffold38857_cov489-Skeletonema_dohrnii-CCMP3373.AAC.1